MAVHTDQIIDGTRFTVWISVLGEMPRKVFMMDGVRVSPGEYCRQLASAEAATA